MPVNNKYNLVAKNTQSTVVAEYNLKKEQNKSYQSETELEKEFIKQLQSQAYQYLPITSEEDLKKNLRSQLEKLNEYEFTNKEWNQFFKTELANQNQGILEKTTTIQEDFIKNLTCDDGTTKNIHLISKDNIHDNTLQVINQYETDQGQRVNRYDVTILVNGLPLVHIELKRRGIAIKEAFNQINRYQQESFWASSGLFEYTQLFVISNGTHTKYYSNTTRTQHIQETKDRKKKGKKTSHSFEFTSWWADATNKPITDLTDFTKTFFAKHTLLNILTRYCVFTVDQELLVMRPYQIVATEKIINRIEVSTNYKKTGSTDAGGYIWHTTGSGKTLTSFKTAKLVSQLNYIKKVLFIVDRKDLDHQTMKEYNKFEQGSANSTNSTAELKKRLEDPRKKIIITTIQKLDLFIKKNAHHNIFNESIVLIFDECHRSQFGNMHIAITKNFKKYHLFGFTGTPIFAKNASTSSKLNLKTTKQAFGDKLHTYTIVNAISDQNVLPFKVDYVSTFRETEKLEKEDKKVNDIDRERALLSPERLEKIVKYIHEHFDQKTKRNNSYQLRDRRLRGFNSIFAVSSIDSAKKYYAEFKKQLANVPSDKKLKIALIYSFGINDDIDDMVDENSENTSELDKSSRDFLEDAISDYNKMFRTNYDTSFDKFPGYYQDVSSKVKNRKIDMLIVVNMFLTGFDATTLNTLWVDKNLRLHGLLQAYSRTNRILNSVKTFGNVVCFRDLEKTTNESIALFGDKDACGIVLLKKYEDYYYDYKNLIDEALNNFPVRNPIASEQSKKEFIKLFGKILRLCNILTTFDEFKGNEILSPRDFQDYQSMYIDLYDEFRKTQNGEKENINDDLIFEMELVKQVEINIDYILTLIKKYHETNMKDHEILIDIEKAIQSSVELRNKKDLINQFIHMLNPQSTIDEDWLKFVEEKKIEELEKIIKDEGLDHNATYNLMKNSFRDGLITTTGVTISNILPSNLSRFDPSGVRTKKREAVLKKLLNFFERFFSISKNQFM